MASTSLASFGAILMGAHSPQQVCEWAQTVERAGFGSLWFAEDYYFASAFGLASAAAAVTSRVSLGIGVVNPYTRHPVLIGMEAATLSGLAPGRVVLGLGSSIKTWIEHQMGIPYVAPLQTVREAVEIVRRLWTQDRVTFAGSRFTVNGVALEVKPAQRELPIFLGAKGRKAVELAADIADGINLSTLATAPHVARVRAQVTAARRAVGRAPEAFRLVAYLPTAVSANGPEARAAVKPLLARYLGILHGQSVLADAGLDATTSRPFRDALLAGRDATGLVGDGLVEQLAVAGTPDECRLALERLADAGLDVPVAYLPASVDWRSQLALIGSELIPFWERIRCR